jgi:hypothetical protein
MATIRKGMRALDWGTLHADAWEHLASTRFIEVKSKYPDNTPEDIKGLSMTWEGIDEPMNTIDPVIIPGPHMYSEDCHCESCAGHRSHLARLDGMVSVHLARLDGMVSVNNDLARKEAVAVKERIDRWKKRGRRGEKPDDTMRVHWSVIISLCDKADNPTVSSAAYETVLRDNESLRAELKAIRERNSVVTPVDHTRSLSDATCGCGSGIRFYIDSYRCAVCEP